MSDDLEISFLGAASTVTGSRHLLKVGSRRYLIDCGLFQGPPALEDLNRKQFPIPVESINAVFLTHAHIDHTGYLPRLVKDGYRGPVYASEATCVLSEIMLRDSAHLQEQDAEYANRKGYSRHKPAVPLYTAKDAEEAIELFRPVPSDHSLEQDGFTIAWRPTGHLLGAGCLDIELSSGMKILFSGDLGRYNSAIMKAPWQPSRANVLVVESTYGNRLHKDESVEKTLAEVLEHVVRNRGVLLIPAFAVGRTQQVLYHIRRLQDEKKAPEIPIYIDSPMAASATDIYCRFGNEHNLSVNLLMDEHACPLRCEQTNFVRKAAASKALNFREGPMIIISASGMCNGGRIVHHLKRRLPDAKNVVLFVGYQAEGTRGRALLDGAKELTIHGENVPVRARVVSVDALSTHPDKTELMRWLSTITTPPRKTFIVHGEPAMSEGLRGEIARTLGWTNIVVPKLGDTHSINSDT